MRVSVGLFIRTNWVEALEVQRGLKHSVKVTKFGRCPILSPDKDKVVEAIKGALDAAKIKAKEVVLAIPTQEVILRYFTLPVIPRHEWAGAIQFEARKYIPFKLEELVWDFHATERKSPRQLDVIFVATRKEVFQEYMALLTQAGLKATVVEAASFSLARALLHFRPELKEATFAAIDVSGDTAHVALIHRGAPQLARDVFLMGRSELKPLEALMTPALPPLAVPAETLEEGTIPAPPPAPSEQEEQFSNLLSELKLSLDYFAREFAGQEVRQILLCGEQATEAWREALAQELKMPVELAQHGQAAAGAKALPSTWALVLGLALHGMTPGPGVNFLRHEIHPSVGGTPMAMAQASSRTFRPLVWETAVACVALLTLAAIKAGELAQLNAQIGRARQDRAQMVLPLPVSDPRQLESIKREMGRRLALLESTVGAAAFLTPKLAALPRLLPEEMWFETITFRTDQTSVSPRFISAMHGLCMMADKAREIALVNQLPERLRADPGFSAGFQEIRLAVVGSQTLGETDVTSFDLQANPGTSAGGPHAR